MYPYPSKGAIQLADLVSLFVNGKIDDKETPRESEGIKQERDNIRECNFIANG